MLTTSITMPIVPCRSAGAGQHHASPHSSTLGRRPAQGKNPHGLFYPILSNLWSPQLLCSNENGSDTRRPHSPHHLRRMTDAMMPRCVLAEHGHASVPLGEGDSVGWAGLGCRRASGLPAYLSRPANVPYVVFHVGNMIDSGQPQHRQLICRHRLAPQSELTSVRPQITTAPFPLEAPRWFLCVLCNHPHPRPQGGTGWQQNARRPAFGLDVGWLCRQCLTGSALSTRVGWQHY